MKELNSRSEDGSITGLSDGSLSYNYAQKFRKEAQNLARLQHPNIVSVTDCFDENGTFYYVMDYIDGQNLNEYIKSRVLSQDEAVAIIKEVAKALQYMHEEKHMLHLDLKPGNIMRRSSDGHIFLIDFGLSKHYNTNGEPETSTTIGLGTAGYAPVEQGNQAKSGEFRPTIDVYALGATLFKLLTAETPPAASELISDDELVATKLKSHEVSEELVAIIVAAMLPNVKKRAQSVSAFVTSLPSVTSSASSSTTIKDKANSEETAYINKENASKETEIVEKSIETHFDFDESIYVVDDKYRNHPATTRKEANGGDKESMLAYGIMCLRGQGVRKDLDIAYAWFTKLKLSGDKRGDILLSQWKLLQEKYNIGYKESNPRRMSGSSATTANTNNTRSRGINLSLWVFFVLIIGAIVLISVLTSNKEIENDSDSPMVSYDSSLNEITYPGGSYKMIYVDGGSFQMGGLTVYGTEPLHNVRLSYGYYIGQTEVTQELWNAIMEYNPSDSLGVNCPVYSVSWNDCQDFIRKLNSLTGQTFKLPTEAEWEFAAKGGNMSHGYKYSGSNNIDDVAWTMFNGEGQNVHPVAEKKANELCLYDMSGNVCEWCSDWHEPFNSSNAQTNPTGPASGTQRVFRGGDVGSLDEYCRSSCRPVGESGCPYYAGLRLALVP